jgi:hypothetical protein
MKNRLFYGDCLDVLKSSIDDESIDLIYIDPPFNSKRNYNVLFEAIDMTDAKAQKEACADYHGRRSAPGQDHRPSQSGDVQHYIQESPAAAIIRSSIATCLYMQTLNNQEQSNTQSFTLLINHVK